MTGFRRGVRLGIDVGKARIGVARCDPDGLLATPVETVARAEGTPVQRIATLAAELSAMEVVVGLPISLQGRTTASTDDALSFAAELAAVGLEIRLVDERLSTVSAHAALRSSGRSQRQSRSMVDQVAAVVLLQQALDVEKSTGRPAGRPLTPQEPA